MTQAASYQDAPRHGASYTEGGRLSARNFKRLGAYIYDYSGIKMPQSKATMLEGRLRRRLRATGIETLDGYCDFLFDGHGIEREAIHLIDAVTTNKTDFFREPNHFDFLRQTILPGLKERGVRRVRTWSAACSTGAEPYTMAMVLEDYRQTCNGPDYSILATDLSTQVLEVATKGIYTQEMVRPVPADLRRRFVMSARDPARGEVRIVPQLRSRVGCMRLNFMDDVYRVGDPMHVIFCRNVLIYFDKKTQMHVLNRLVDCLLPGGHLLIGHSESITGMNLPVRQLANTVFVKE
ncbi:chemotaxis protein methyltransferase CheR [Rhizobium sp. PP-F2F-G20b]|nr:chemotaxis protein methyltransferase CheR [Rhizobium sp. PP-CC-3A-592]PYE41839.1 chemotaxis protein methyltransferase CheR [Rhizobium sp. PP-F2F-G20b]